MTIRTITVCVKVLNAHATGPALAYKRWPALGDLPWHLNLIKMESARFSSGLGMVSRAKEAMKTGPFIFKKK